MMSCPRRNDRRVGDLAVDQGQVAGPAALGGVGLVEAENTSRVVPARGRDVAHPRILLPAHVKDIVLDLLVITLLAKGATANRHDRSRHLPVSYLGLKARAWRRRSIGHRRAG